MNINKLPETFEGKSEVKGYSFKKVDENNLMYVYEAKNELTSNTHFEVFYKKTTPILIDFKKRLYSDTEFKEIYPKSNNFGVWAWTTHNKQKAKELMDKLTKEKQKRNEQG